MANENKNHLARFHLPVGIIRRDFIAWFIEQFPYFFPVNDSGSQIHAIYALAAYAETFFCRYNITEEPGEPGITSINVEAIRNENAWHNFATLSFLEFIPKELAEIRLSASRNTTLYIDLLIAHNIALPWLQKLAVGIIDMWPESQIIVGQWLLEEKESDLEEDDEESMDTEPDTEVDWSKEPDSMDREDWFKHRRWCEANGVRPQTHRYMAGKVGLSEGRFKHAYRNWKTEQGFS